MAPITLPSSSSSTFSHATEAVKRASTIYTRAVLSALPHISESINQYNKFKRQVIVVEDDNDNDDVNTVTPLPGGTVAIPATYTDLNDSTPAGQVVGITLGAVAGFILLIWLIYSTCGPKAAIVQEESVVTEPPPRKRRHRSRSRSTRRRRSESLDHVREIREIHEVRTDQGFVPMPVPMPAPVYEPPPPRVVREVVEERRERGVSRGSRRSRAPSLSASSDGMDEVVVIEDHSPSPRRARRSRSRRDSGGGYRPVDPERWAGGDAEMRRVRRY